MRLNTPKPLNISVRWLHYEVSDEDNLRRLYGAFDRNKTRSGSHVLKALLAGTSGVDGIWSSEIDRYGAALRFWLFDTQQLQHSNGPNEIAELIQEKIHSTA